MHFFFTILKTLFLNLFLINHLKMMPPDKNVIHETHMLMVILKLPSVAHYHSSSSSPPNKNHTSVSPLTSLSSPSSHPSLHRFHTTPPPQLRSSLCTPSHLVSHVCASITCAHAIFNVTECLSPPSSSIHLPASSYLCLLCKCILHHESWCIYVTICRMCGETSTSVSNVLHFLKGIHSASAALTNSSRAKPKGHTKEHLVSLHASNTSIKDAAPPPIFVCIVQRVLT